LDRAPTAIGEMGAKACEWLEEAGTERGERGKGTRSEESMSARVRCACDYSDVEAGCGLGSVGASSREIGCKFTAAAPAKARKRIVRRILHA